LLSEKSISDYREMNHCLLELRRLSLFKLDPSLFNLMKTCLQKLIDHTVLETDKSEPNPANQRVLDSSRALADIMEILRKPFTLAVKEQKDELIEIRKMCFRLLQRYCRKEQTIKTRLFEMLDELLAVEGAEEEMAECVAELFLKNEELALKISEAQVKTIVALLGKFHIHQLLKALNAIARVGFYPLKRNQNFVVKHLMQARKTTILYVDSADRQFRLGNNPSQNTHTHTHTWVDGIK